MYGKVIALFMVIPSFFFFFAISKYRDMRFVFTFCFADTVSAVVLILSIIVNYYITPETNITMFVIRMIGYPLVELLVYKKVRQMYFEVQDTIKKGWGIFSIVSIIFYILLLVLFIYPYSIVDRPKDMPAMIIICFLMPLMYVNIFQVLDNQRRLYAEQRNSELWEIQSTHMQSRIEQLTESDKQIKMMRHDLRHQLQIIDVMIQKKEYEEAKRFIEELLQQSLGTDRGSKYCKNVVLDAMFSYYFQLAEKKKIRIEHALVIPEVLPISDTQFSVVIANAMENAIRACEKLPENKRVIRIRSIDSPQIMLRIGNYYEGKIVVDNNGVPVSKEAGHGIGTRSILAFCEKHNSNVDYKIEEDYFEIRIIVRK